MSLDDLASLTFILFMLSASVAMLLMGWALFRDLKGDS